MKAAYVCMLIVEIDLAGEFILLLGNTLLLNFLVHGNHGYRNYDTPPYF